MLNSVDLQCTLTVRHPKENYERHTANQSIVFKLSKYILFTLNTP